MTDDETAFLATIKANPASGSAKEIFSDWLEEQGRIVEATGWRWAGQHGKHPLMVHDGYSWIRDSNERYHRDNRDPSWLPPILYDAIPANRLVRISDSYNPVAATTIYRHRRRKLSLCFRDLGHAVLALRRALGDVS